jgi:hypothetical protein
MKSLLGFLTLLSVAITSQAHASGLNDFMRGFAETTSQTLDAREYQRQQQAIYQSDFNAVRSKLQSEYDERQRDYRIHSDRGALHFSEDLEKCAAAVGVVAPATAVELTACMNKAFAKQHAEVGNPNKDELHKFMSRNERIAKQYADGKITQTQFGSRTRKNVEGWNELQYRDAKARIERDYEAMNDLAHKQASVMYYNQHQAQAQQDAIAQQNREIESLTRSVQNRQSTNSDSVEQELSRLKRAIGQQEQEIRQLKSQ